MIVKGTDRVFEEYYLHPAESLRVAAMLEQASEKLKLLSMLNSDISMMESGTKEDEKENTESTVAAILEDQRALSQRYQELNNMRAFQGLSTPIDVQKARLQEMLDIMDVLKNNTKSLCRNLKETPNEANNWKKVKRERSDIVDMLFSCRRELLSSLIPSTVNMKMKMGSTGGKDAGEAYGAGQQIRYAEFAKRIVAEKMNKQFLDDIVEREQSKMQEVKLLQAMVLKERELKEREINERTVKVAKLQADLRHYKRLVKEDSEKTQATKDAEFECHRRIEKASLKRLDDELRRVRMEFEIEARVNAQTLKFLETANGQLNDRGSEWNDKYKKESSSLQSELGSWEARRKTQLEKKEDLEDRYAKDLFDKKQYEESVSAEEDRIREYKEKKLRDAATRIKLAYISYKAREMFEDRKRDKKKKKKGRKKKKK